MLYNGIQLHAFMLGKQAAVLRRTRRVLVALLDRAFNMVVRNNKCYSCVEHS